MGNKSLSQQICEICGIKPKYKYKRIPCEFFEGVVYVCKLKSSPHDEVICGDPSNCDDYTPSISPRYRHEEKPFYPDFENNNNNFVKLMELDFDSCSDEDIRFPSLWCFLNSFMFALESRENYLIYLLGFLKDNRSEWRENLQRDVKQAIRQADWEV